MKPKKNIEEVMVKENPEFVSEVASLSTEELDARIAQLAKDLEAVDEAKEADEALKDLRDQVSIASAPYNESKKALKLKTKYLIQLMKSRGSV